MLISKRRFYRILFSLISLILVVIVPGNSIFFITTMVVAALVTAAITLNIAFKNKHFVYFIFTAFDVEMLMAMFISIYVFKTQETSWRTNYDIDNINFLSLKLICISLIIMFFTYNCLIDGEKKVLQKPVLVWNHHFLLILYIAIILFIPIFVINEKETFFSLRDYTQITGTTLISLYRLLQVVFFTTYYKKDKNSFRFIKYIGNILFFLFIMIDFLMCINGFRFILMEVVLLLIFLNLEKMKKKSIFLIGILAVVLYVFFTAISIYRNGITEINQENFFKSMFGHERSEFYSLNAILINRPSEHINTYMETISHIIPSVFLKGNELYENTGRILLKYISIEAYNSSNITYGGFYLTEAYFNFGTIGIVLISFILSVFFICVEKDSTKNIVANLCYYIIISQSYTIVFYGSSNYFKPIFYYFIFAVLLSKFQVVKMYNPKKLL